MAKFDTHAAQAHEGGGGTYEDDPIVPKGTYRARINSVKTLTSEEHKGETVMMKMSVREASGKQTDITMFQNLVSKNGKDNLTGQKKHLQLAQAAGVKVYADGIEDDEFDGTFVEVKLGVEPAKGQFKARNTIVAVRPAGQPAQQQRNGRPDPTAIDDGPAPTGHHRYGVGAPDPTVPDADAVQQGAKVGDDFDDPIPF